MRLPEFLKKGDTIGIVAPARKISLQELQPAIDWLTAEGFQLKPGENLFAEHNQFAGSDEQRLADFQSMLDNPEVKAILCARGGYGSLRIIDLLNFDSFLNHPKWICGYSDITVFHAHIHTLFQIPTIHGTMPVNITKESTGSESAQSLLKALRGGGLEYHVKPHPLNRSGEAKGTLIGGNLSILYALSGSKSDLDTSGKILFIEDLDEYLYHIDRMMMNLKRSGKLRNLTGMIIGGLSDMNDNTIPYGKTAEEIVAEHCAEYTFPICFGFPAGHISPNVAIRLGTEHHLTINESVTLLKENI